MRRVTHDDRRAQDRGGHVRHLLAHPDLGLELGRLVVVLELLPHHQLVLVDHAACAARPRRRCSRRPGARASSQRRRARARCRCRPRSRAGRPRPARPGRRWRRGGRRGARPCAGGPSRRRTRPRRRSEMSPASTSMRFGVDLLPRPPAPRRASAARPARRASTALLVEQPLRQAAADEAGEAGQQVDRHGAAIYSSASGRPAYPRSPFTLRRVTRREIKSWLMDMDGVLVHEEQAIPGAADFLGALREQRHPVPGPDQQLDLHAPRPRRPAAHQRPRGPRGVDLDLRARHRQLPRGPAARRLGVRDRRVGADDRAARGRLHPHRPRPRLRGPRRDAHLQLRADHAGHPPDRRRRPLHRHQPRPDRPDAARARCRPPARWRP